MKIDLEFPSLDSLIDKMGAKHTHWSPENLVQKAEAIRRELEKGKEIELGAVGNLDGTLLVYEGQQVILYIKDSRKDKFTLLHDLDSAPKFHIAECNTLERMRIEGRFERYVVTTNTTGIFTVDATDQVTRQVEELESTLHVCRNCLKKLNWKLYNDHDKIQKTEIRDTFAIDEFFAEYRTFFSSKPRNTDKTAGIGGYVSNWPKISERCKSEEHWCCSKCHVDLKEHRSLLHTHHKNGVVTDNARSNLEVLCVVCHSEQPAHKWMKPGLKERLLIESLRKSNKTAS